MPIYMQYPNIPGDVNTKGHDDGTWLELSSFQFGTGRGLTSPTGGSADREASTPNVSEVVVTKGTDCSSCKLFQASLGGGPAGEAQDVNIDFCKTDVANPEKYLSITLRNCLISGYSVSSGGDRPTESITLNFTKIEITNIGMKAKNDTGEQEVVNYDLAAQTVG
jgi:type VI secretion system secreted protein Hcp